MQQGEIHQDWEPVVLKKNIQKKQTNTFNPEGSKKLRELDSDDIPKIVYVSKEEAQNVIDARKVKNLKQIDLAKLCNIDVSIIRDFETSKIPSDKQLYNKLLRVCGVKIEKK